MGGAQTSRTDCGFTVKMHEPGLGMAQVWRCRAGPAGRMCCWGPGMSGTVPPSPDPQGVGHQHWLGAGVGRTLGRVNICVGLEHRTPI